MNVTNSKYILLDSKFTKSALIISMSLLFWSCAHIQTPTAYIRPSSQLLTMRATLKEAQETKARVYFRTKGAEVYEIEYQTKRGSTFFHKYLLADKIYDELPEGEFVVRIRAVADGKKSNWKTLR